MGQIEAAEAAAAAIRAEIAEIEAQAREYASELGGINARLAVGPDVELEARAAGLRLTVDRLRALIPPNGDRFGDVEIGRRLLTAMARADHLRKVRASTLLEIAAAEGVERRWRGKLPGIMAALAGIYGDVLSAGGPAAVGALATLRNELDRQRAVIDSLPGLRRSLAELGGE